jgi:hypothetical protein
MIAKYSTHLKLQKINKNNSKKTNQKIDRGKKSKDADGLSAMERMEADQKRRTPDQTCVLKN